MVRAALIAILISAACLGGCKRRLIVNEVEVSLAPLSGSQGQTLTLFVTGIGTSFHGDDPSTPALDGDPIISISGEGSGLVPRHVTVDNPHRARLSLHITPDAPVTGDSTPPGRILVETAGEVFTFEFNVLGASSLPQVSIEPDSGLAGIGALGLDVKAVEGTTAFVDGETVVSFPELSGVHVTDSVVISPALVEITVAIDEDAPEQSFPVTVTTGADVATTPFRVLSGEGGPVLAIEPGEAHKGTTIEATLTVSGGDEEMVLMATDLLLSFPYNPGISTVALEYVDAHTASATIRVSEDAVHGTFQALLESGGRVAKGSFRVLPAADTDPFLRLYPSVVERGVAGQDVTIHGVYTHFSSTESGLSILPGSGITVDGFWVLDETRAVAVLTVGTDALLESSVFSVSTGLEVAAAVLTTIEPTSLAVTVEPGTVEQGVEDVALDLHVVGADLLGATTVGVEFPGLSGVSIDSVSVVSSSLAEVIVDVADTAPTGVTLLTLAVDGEEATSPFLIDLAAGRPGFTIDPPFLTIPSGDVGITLTGTGTTWADGVHQLLFSDTSIEVIDFRVTAPGRATATVRGPAWVESRRTVAWVYSASDISAAWWMVLPPGYRSVRLSPVPAEVEAGSTGTLFLAVGEGTGFVDGLTTAHTPPGSGIEVTRVEVDRPDLAVIEVDVSTDAAAGDYGLTLSTGGETGLARIAVIEDPTPKEATIQPVSGVVADTWTTVTIEGTDTHFTGGVTTVHAAVPEYEDPLLLIASASVLDPLTVGLDLAPTISGLTTPLEIATDLEVVRACLSVLADASDPYPVLETLVVRPGEVTTLPVRSMGSPAPNFTTDAPSVASSTTGVTVSDISVLAIDLVEIDVDVAPDVTGSIELVVHGTGYSWNIVLPVLPVPPSLRTTSTPGIVAGTRDETLGVESDGFALDDASLRSASPGRVMFVDATASTGSSSADIAYSAAIGESDTDTLLYVLPEAAPWAMPVSLDVAATDVRVVGLPSSVYETIPTSGWDDVGFTPSSTSRLGLWAVLDGDTSGPPLEIIDEDGISVKGRCDGTSVTAFIEPASTRHYASLGGGTLAGSSYWIGVQDVLPGLTHLEAEPNDDFYGAEGIAGPGGTTAVLASIGTPGDRDFFQIRYSGDTPSCYEVVSTRWIAGNFSSPYISLSLWDPVLPSPPVPLLTEVGSDIPGLMDPMLCTDGLAVDHRLLVEGMAGTLGPYLLVPRWPLIVSELDHTVPFVEVTGKPGYSLSGYSIEILDASSGSLRGFVSLSSLGTVPVDGFVVVASPGVAEGVDIEDSTMDLMTVPYVVRVCHSGHMTCDRVQVGGTPGFGEGAVLDPADMPAGRLWGVDTDRNATDFVQLVAATPGAQNALPVP